MFKVKDKNGVEVQLPKYVAKCTTVGSGNIFVGKAKARFVKEADDSKVIQAADAKESSDIFVSTMPFGEVISLVSSAGNTVDVTVEGKDYMGQKMVEQITLNGATAVAGKKAFKLITKTSTAAAASADITMKTTGVVGLEFATIGADVIAKNGVKNTDITITVGSRTQTATSADTRGTVNLTSAAAGDVIDVVYNVTDYVADDKGGLFGVPHYAG